MTLLALDTTQAACSVALADGAGGILAAEREIIERGHAEALVPMLDRVLQAAGCGIEAVSQVAVTVGPGSFTGVRVGLAAARALVLATDAQGLGFTAFEALAAAALFAEPPFAGRHILAAMDARRGQIYAQAFAVARNDGAPLVPVDAPYIGPADGLGARARLPGLAVVGGGRDLVLDAFAPTDAPGNADAPDAAALARLAATGQAPRSLTPLYLRPPDAKPVDGTPDAGRHSL